MRRTRGGFSVFKKASYLAAGSAVVLMKPMKVRPPHRLMPGKCIGFESPLTDIDCSYIMLYYVITKMIEHQKHRK